MDIYSLKRNSSHLKLSRAPKRKGSSSNHPFSGANLLLVSGRANEVNPMFSKKHWLANCPIHNHNPQGTIQFIMDIDLQQQISCEARILNTGRRIRRKTWVSPRPSPSGRSSKINREEGKTPYKRWVLKEHI